jgi:hypothetical protein
MDATDDIPYHEKRKECGWLWRIFFVLALALLLFWAPLLLETQKLCNYFFGKHQEHHHVKRH